jgi:PhnB protein
MAKAIPDGFHTATPYLIVRNAGEALDFYREAFGAEELVRMPSPDGKMMHAEMRIGDSIVFLSDEFPEMNSYTRAPAALGGVTGSIHLYVQDVDGAVDRAVKAGAQVRMPVQDMFWGDRFGRVADPFGHEWSLATHTEDLTPEQVAQRAAQAFAPK